MIVLNRDKALLGIRAMKHMELEWSDSKIYSPELKKHIILNDYIEPN